MGNKVTIEKINNFLKNFEYINNSKKVPLTEYIKTAYFTNIKNFFSLEELERFAKEYNLKLNKEVYKSLTNDNEIEYYYNKIKSLISNPTKGSYLEYLVQNTTCKEPKKGDRLELKYYKFFDILLDQWLNIPDVKEIIDKNYIYYNKDFYIQIFKFTAAMISKELKPIFSKVVAELKDTHREELRTKTIGELVKELYPNGIKTTFSASRVFGIKTGFDAGRLRACYNFITNTPIGNLGLLFLKIIKGSHKIGVKYTTVMLNPNFTKFKEETVTITDLPMIKIYYKKTHDFEMITFANVVIYNHLKFLNENKYKPLRESRDEFVQFLKDENEYISEELVDFNIHEHESFSIKNILGFTGRTSAGHRFYNFKNMIKKQLKHAVFNKYAEVDITASHFNIGQIILKCNNIQPFSYEKIMELSGLSREKVKNDCMKIINGDYRFVEQIESYKAFKAIYPEFANKIMYAKMHQDLNKKLHIPIIIYENKIISTCQKLIDILIPDAVHSNEYDGLYVSDEYAEVILELLKLVLKKFNILGGAKIKYRAKKIIYKKRNEKNKKEIVKPIIDKSASMLKFLTYTCNIDNSINIFNLKFLYKKQQKDKIATKEKRRRIYGS